MLPGSIFEVSNASQVAFSLRWMQKGGAGRGAFLQIPGKHQAAWRCARQLEIQMWQIYLQMCALNSCRFVVFPQGCGNARRRGGTVGFRADLLGKWDSTSEQDAQKLQSWRRLMRKKIYTGLIGALWKWYYRLVCFSYFINAISSYKIYLLQSTHLYFVRT